MLLACCWPSPRGVVSLASHAAGLLLAKPHDSRPAVAGSRRPPGIVCSWAWLLPLPLGHPTSWAAGQHGTTPEHQPEVIAAAPERYRQAIVAAAAAAAGHHHPLLARPALYTLPFTPVGPPPAQALNPTGPSCLSARRGAHVGNDALATLLHYRQGVEPMSATMH